jgi:hypothetical protein
VPCGGPEAQSRKHGQLAAAPCGCLARTPFRPGAPSARSARVRGGSSRGRRIDGRAVEQDRGVRARQKGLPGADQRYLQFGRGLKTA